MREIIFSNAMTGEKQLCIRREKLKKTRLHKLQYRVLIITNNTVIDFFCFFSCVELEFVICLTGTLNMKDKETVMQVKGAIL